MSNILRDMRKGKSANATKKLNLSQDVPYAGMIMSHVAQGILKASRKIRKDHVIWKPEEERSREHGKERVPIITEGGTFVSY